ncbi:MAG: hypothetical protein GXP22_02950 [Gammaproteobacteria bacterium]|nr:hypothetical protein [Gammaproteobacteria bacterium]
MKIKDREKLHREIVELQTLLLDVDKDSDKEVVWAAYLISYSLSQCWRSLLKIS